MNLGILSRKIRVALTPRSWQLRTRLSNGAVVSGYNRAGWGGRGVYIFRDELEPELAALAQFVRPGDTFIDIGANVGVFSMKAARQVGAEGLVIAVEPFPESSAQVHRNIILNRFENVRLRNFCMGAVTGPVQFFMNFGAPNCFSLIKEGDASAFNTFCVSLDDLARWEQITRLDYLKLDAEGAEEPILQGGAATIQRFRPIIQLEVSLNGTHVPAGYRRFSIGHGLNNLLLPDTRPEALATADSLGWKEVTS